MQRLSTKKKFASLAPACWLLVCALAACGEVASGNPDGGLADAAGPDAAPDAAVDAGPSPLRLITHSTSTTIESGLSPACTAEDGDDTIPNRHRDNSYFRVFHMPDHDITGAFDISIVRLGIERATSESGMQPAELRLHLLPDGADLLLANLTPLDSTSVTVADQGRALLEIPIETTVPAGATLVVEFHIPDGVADGNTLFVGANNLGESAPSYMQAASCNIPEPSPWANQGYTENHLVLTVLGRER